MDRFDRMEVSLQLDRDIRLMQDEAEDAEIAGEDACPAITEGLGGCTTRPRAVVCIGMGLVHFRMG